MSKGERVISDLNFKRKLRHQLMSDNPKGPKASADGGAPADSAGSSWNRRPRVRVQARSLHGSVVKVLDLRSASDSGYKVLARDNPGAKLAASDAATPHRPVDA